MGQGLSPQRGSSATVMKVHLYKNSQLAAGDSLPLTRLYYNIIYLGVDFLQLP